MVHHHLEVTKLVEFVVDLSFHGEREIKGVSKRQKLWQLHFIREGATRFDASLARGLSNFVGRDDELAMMCSALDRARDGLCVTDLVAEPGLGKTRLVFEFLQHVKLEATVLTGHCSADGQQVPFMPFLEVMRRSFRIRDVDDLAEIARKFETGLRRRELYTRENLGLLLNLLGIKHEQALLEGLDGVLIGLRTRDLLPACSRPNVGSTG